MKRGVCPKCAGREIYATRDNQYIENSPINDRHLIAMKIYVCYACGYLEEYIQNRADLDNIPTLKLVEKINSWD